RLGDLHWSSRVSSIRTTRSVVLATSARSALTSVVLPVEVPPATRTLRRLPTARRSTSRDGRFADGKGRRGNDRRYQSFEPLTGFRQFRRDAWSCRMHFRTNMMGDEADEQAQAAARDKGAERCRRPQWSRPPRGNDRADRSRSLRLNGAALAWRL